MEAQTDLQTYMERGKEALAHGQARDAAIAYAHAAQLDPNNPMVHLGLAEANLALGDYRVVELACQRTQELQPEGGIEATTAQALLDRGKTVLKVPSEREARSTRTGQLCVIVLSQDAEQIRA